MKGEKTWPQVCSALGPIDELHQDDTKIKIESKDDLVTQAFSPEECWSGNQFKLSDLCCERNSKVLLTRFSILPIRKMS